MGSGYAELESLALLCTRRCCLRSTDGQDGFDRDTDLSPVNRYEGRRTSSSKLNIACASLEYLLTSTRGRLLTFNLLIFRIVEWFLHHRCSIPYTKQLHLDLSSWRGIFYRQIPVGDTLAYSVTVASTGYTAQHTLTIEERLTAQSHGSRIIDDQATQFACNTLCF